MCGNCGAPSPKLLARVDAATSPLVTSDARRLNDVVVRRTLCARCACVEVQYDPPDRLQRFFREDYDLADEIQSNLIVRDGRTLRKHDHINTQLFAQLDDLPARGRYLEIACGKGELARRFQAARPEWECVGIDPSAQAPRAGPPRTGEVTFIRDCFSERPFGGTTFDVIVAHGFLNRSPVVPELLRMRTLARPGTLLSVEIGILENSVFTPHTWDHPFMYLARAFEAYLEHAGFSIRTRTSCVSTRHFLCACTGTPRPRGALQLGADVVARTEGCFVRHKAWWAEAVRNCAPAVAAGAGSLGLYGAGLYNAVLLSLLPGARFDFVVDDLKAGGTFHGLPVVTAEQAAARPGARVCICARPEYVAGMTARLHQAGVEHEVVSPLADAGAPVGLAAAATS
jgi:SAM-dependent methyltransferase